MFDSVFQGNEFFQIVGLNGFRGSRFLKISLLYILLAVFSVAIKSFSRNIPVAGLLIKIVIKYFGRNTETPK